MSNINPPTKDTFGGNDPAQRDTRKVIIRAKIRELFSKLADLATEQLFKLLDKMQKNKKPPRPGDFTKSQ